MIDYDKLKLAHELAEKLSESEEQSYVRIDFGYVWQNNEIRYGFDLDYSSLGASGQIVRVNNIDDLITKLRELTQPKAKYEKMLDLYWTFNNVIYAGKLGFVTKVDNSVRYQIILENGEYINLDETQIYPTKQFLIEAQIDYWIKLRHENNMDNLPKFEGEIKAFNLAEDKLREPSITINQPKCPECESDLAWYSGRCADVWRRPCSNWNCDYIEEIPAKDCDHEPMSTATHIDEGGCFNVHKCGKCGDSYQ